MSVEQILAAARAEIGTPFRHQGRVSGKALDCAGLICHVASVIGLEYFDCACATPADRRMLPERRDAHTG